MTKPVFLGGSLSFKGDRKKKAKKKSRKSKHRRQEDGNEEISLRQDRQAEDDPVIGSVAAGNDDGDDDMTAAERRALKYRLEKEKKDLKQVAAKSHRERVEEFNQKLGELTEHNDIPRVSAAGNG
mmetsp:Transcript_7365/g.8818  ORF Transcript_7365/g.8818 Transcript_7365/m.8818 type:complete len:125 (-) Transcript_7365:289-663(-)|eukprot:CAMPEP_0195257626 /NCGR_PEP_ID=MMETSP0706-20130129/6924_1 /TAXON_ID=33640 /ORGANISM="Asterionellopsis glacialis, Strain CCMP134" /LENGTH=124 /DNA_ID=CAMNT_0040310857 /DNA_START=94 /DNA_END=468 /DNA_ORIENTATION=-